MTCCRPTLVTPLKGALQWIMLLHARFLSLQPDKKIKLTISYPMTTGRDFNEILRVIDSLQLTDRQQLATPANWVQGDDVVIVSLRVG